MRDYAEEFSKRVEFIRQTVSDARSDGIIFANSGGKDCVLAGILCKAACERTLSVIMPCESRRNYNEDKQDALLFAEKFGIETITVDLTSTKRDLSEKISDHITITPHSGANIAPRLRMVTLYAIGNSMNYLVAGTGNKSEIHMGYFTKWGDGAYDFNPIADLTVTEVYEFLKHLKAPESIINKPPSAGLFDGQTDEEDMGVTYAQIDNYIKTGTGTPEAIGIIERYHNQSTHKRRMPLSYDPR